MDNSQSGSYEVAKSNICQSCGSVTGIYEETASNKKNGIIYVVLGWFFSIISFLFMPILFGGIAILNGLYDI